MSHKDENVGYTDLGGAMAGLYMTGRLVARGEKIATVEIQVGPEKFERRRVKTEHLVSLHYARQMNAHNRPEYA